MAKIFNSTPLEVRKEILHLEVMEFENCKYHSGSEIGGSNLKWVPNPWKFQRRRLCFLHSVLLQRKLETLLNMVISDKQVANYELFVGQEEIKRIVRDIKYNLDDIVVRLNWVECFVVLDSKTNSNDHQNEATVINTPPLNIAHANSSPHTHYSFRGF